MPIDKVISYVDSKKDLDVLIVDKDMNIITSKNFKYEEVKNKIKTCKYVEIKI